jgi:hypothetical protein
MMLGSAELLRAWVLGTLAALASDDELHARLRETLLVFLRTGGSYKTTAEQLMLHKTRSSTGSARRRRAWAGRWVRIGMRWNWPCRPATGSARPC